MNLTVLCPECQRPLRVPSNLLGQAVRCPSCTHTFLAPESVEEGPRRPAEPSPKVASDKEPRPAPRLEPGEDRREDDEEALRHPRQRPGKVQAIAILVLVGGIHACIWGLGSMPLSGFFCCFWPGAYYSVVMGIMAIVKGTNLLGDRAFRLPPPQGIAVMMIVNIINADVVNLTLGILVLVFLGDPEVKAYFRR